jgi:hypothetical protein
VATTPFLLTWEDDFEFCSGEGAIRAGIRVIRAGIRVIRAGIRVMMPPAGK